MLHYSPVCILAYHPQLHSSSKSKADPCLLPSQVPSSVSHWLPRQPHHCRLQEASSLPEAQQQAFPLQAKPLGSSSVLELEEIFPMPVLWSSFRPVTGGKLLFWGALSPPFSVSSAAPACPSAPWPCDWDGQLWLQGIVSLSLVLYCPQVLPTPGGLAGSPLWIFFLSRAAILSPVSGFLTFLSL